MLQFSLKSGMIEGNLRETARVLLTPRAASNHERFGLSMATHDYTPEQMQRFWSKVDTSGGDNACWLWIAGLTRGGYGNFTPVKGNPRRAHRVAWEMTYGVIPDGLCVLHDCPDGDNPRCVNPAHLWLGTQAQNMRDMQRKGRGSMGEQNGMIKYPEKQTTGSKNALAKFTDEQVVALRNRYAAGGISIHQLAREAGVQPSTMFRLLKCRSYKTVKGAENDT
jgi:hypothetical protein